MKASGQAGRAAARPFTSCRSFDSTAIQQVRDGVIEIRAVRRKPREGWADDARRIAGQRDDALVWPEFANDGDDDLVW
jgi:hypothetical protein